MIDRLLNRIADHFANKPPPTLQEELAMDLRELANCVEDGNKPHAQMWLQRCDMRFWRWQSEHAEPNTPVCIGKLKGYDVHCPCHRRGEPCCDCGADSE